MFRSRTRRRSKAAREPPVEETRRQKETTPGQSPARVGDSAPHPTQVVAACNTTSNPPGGLPITTEEGQNMQGENGVASSTPAAGYFRTLVGVLTAGTEPAPSPRDRMKEELCRTRANVKHFEQECRHAEAETRHLHRACVQLDDENRRQKDTIQNLQHELTNMGRELQEYMTLADDRGKELIGAQASLRRADLLFISEDLKDMVITLNDEIFQASAFLGDSSSHYKFDSTPEEIDAAFAGVCRTVGDTLARVLLKETKKPESELNHFLVQVVFEMLLVQFCYTKIESRLLGDEETSDFLTTIYNEIRRTEEPAVSGRCRALIDAQIRPIWVTWKHEFMNSFDNVIVLAEWGVMERWEDIVAFEQKLAAIFKATKELKIALRQKVTSINVAVSVVPPGCSFNCRWMKDGYGDVLQGNTNEIVAGTTGIGLKKVLPRSPSGEERFDDILSVKVLLVSTLKKALLPMPPPAPRSNKGKLGDQEDRGRAPPSMATPSLKQPIVATTKTVRSNRRVNFEFINDPRTIATDNIHQSWSASRAILDGAGAAPVMGVVDLMLELRKEIVKASKFLAESIVHCSYELFRDELDRCSQDSKRMVGERLSHFLHENCEAEELSQALIKTTIQIFIASFCASEWEFYLDQQRTTPHIETERNPTQNHERKALFLRNLTNIFKVAAWLIPGLTRHAAFVDSLNPFFKLMEETEAALKRIPNFITVSLSIFYPGEDWTDSTSAAIATFRGPSPPQRIVLGTISLGLHCLFQDRNGGVNEQTPRTLLTAKVLLEETGNLGNRVFSVREEQKLSSSSQNTSAHGDGRDP